MDSLDIIIAVLIGFNTGVIISYAILVLMDISPTFKRWIIESRYE